MKTAIVIPARYGSTRFPGKPLVEIAGRSMLSRVIDVARKAIDGLEDVEILVTSEDQRIADHARLHDTPCVLTPETCPTGSDRALAALEGMEEKPDFVLNLQGDAPFTLPEVVRSMIEAFQENPNLDVITPVHRLSWVELDTLRENKKTTPFSGTTAVMNADNRALWFSKNIIPAIRKENALRKASSKSPVYQHIGLYGFRYEVLERFCALPPSGYEVMEGLEQLRLLENGIEITCVKVEMPEGTMQSGIDTPEDLSRAEELLAKTP